VGQECPWGVHQCCPCFDVRRIHGRGRLGGLPPYSIPSGSQNGGVEQMESGAGTQ
jgi:hypothetical protein